VADRAGSDRPWRAADGGWRGLRAARLCLAAQVLSGRRTAE
jgi:hypothetical protein